jgi:hypothetical protein
LHNACGNRRASGNAGLAVNDSRRFSGERIADWIARRCGGIAMRFRLTKHATEELRLRSIPRQLVDEVMDQPQQIVDEYGGRKAYQSKLDFGGGRIFLLRVIVDDRADPATVVTVYRTTKIGKYWV